MVANARELVVKIQAQNAQLLRALDQADNRIGRFAANTNRKMALVDKATARANRAFSRLASPVVIGAIVAGFTIAVKKAIDFADEIGKTADRIGVTTDALQIFRRAGTLAGVELGKLDKGLEQFSKRLGEAKADTGSLTEFLKRSDQAFLDQVNATDSVSEALELVIERLAETENASERAALANAAFGRSGIAMVNIARNGAEALKQARIEAEKYGLVIGEDMVRQAEAAADQLSLVGDAIKTNVIKGLISASPAILELGKVFAEAAPHVGDFLAAFGGDRFKSLETLKNDLQAVRSEILQAEITRDENPIREFFGGADDLAFNKRFIDDLVLEAERLEKLVAARERLLNRIKTPPGDDTGADSEPTKAEERIAALRREQDAISTSAPQLAVLNQLRAAGIEVSRAMVDTEGNLTAALSEEANTIARLTQQITSLNESESAHAALVAEVTALQASVATEAERRTEKEMLLTEAVTAGIITDEEKIEVLKRLEEQQDKTNKKTDDGARAAREAARETKALTQDGLNVLDDALQGNLKSWEDWASAVLRILERVIIKQIEASQIGAGGGSGGSIFSGIFSGVGDFFSGIFGGSSTPIPGDIGFGGGGGAGPFGFARGAVDIGGPGTSTSDSIPGLLSRGESVINAAGTRLNAPILRAINAGADLSAVSAPANINAPITINVPAGMDPAAVGRAVRAEMNAVLRRANSAGVSDGQQRRAVASSVGRAAFEDS